MIWVAMVMTGTFAFVGVIAWLAYRTERRYLEGDCPVPMFTVDASASFGETEDETWDC